jgi:hypothetical protein
MEKIFIQNPLEIESFFEYFIQCLVFDYVCKNELPGEIQKIIFSKFLIPTFFMNKNATLKFKISLRNYKGLKYVVNRIVFINQ